MIDEFKKRSKPPLSSVILRNSVLSMSRVLMLMFVGITTMPKLRQYVVPLLPKAV